MGKYKTCPKCQFVFETLDIDVVKKGCMCLPEGKTCNDCSHYARCKALGVIRITKPQTSCDWWPIRFMFVQTEKVELRPEVQKFAEEMEKQLRANEHKGGWKDCDYKFLDEEMYKNSAYLNIGICVGNKKNVIRRAANVANFAMMIADNWGGLMDGGDQ